MKLRNILPLLIIFTSQLFAQFDPHPELDWFSIETKHFYVHYHTGSERTANTVAKIAEEVYGPITSLYNFKPTDKTSFVINDANDYGNGATDYYGNRIEIYATTLDIDFKFRGTHNWLRNVITHEYTHAVQVQSAMKFSRKMPGMYLQWLNYEGERRPDILYGYPNVIVSYPISGVVVPAWYAEGTAQYQRQQLGYDQWDSHRDMILRMRTLGNNLLTWEEMGTFASATTYRAESIYNQGFALTRYIAWKYGEDKLKELSGYMGNLFSLNSESAFRKAIGKSGSDLYNEWKSYLLKDYTSRISMIKPFAVEGKVISDVGFSNFFPKITPDGKKISYLSNKTYDYGSTSLFIRSIDKDKDEELLIAGVPVNYSWLQDGKTIVFSRRNPADLYGVRKFDLYEFNITSKEETKLTDNLRAHSPSLSFDDKKIVFVINGDGTQNLAVADYKKGSKIKKYTKLTNFKDGEQVYNPKWSPDGKYIYSDYALNSGRSIIKVNVETQEFMFVLTEEGKTDYRDVTFSPDGKKMLFASDLTGIYNIYSCNIENDSFYLKPINNEEVHQLSNVIGGAFMPNIDNNGNLVFSTFQSTGYKINHIKSPVQLDTVVTNNKANYSMQDRLITKYANENKDNSTSYKNKFDWEKLKKIDDKNISIKKKENYSNVSTPVFIIPVIRFDDYSKEGGTFWDVIKPGLYLYSSDVLGRMGFFGGASVNRRWERDLFLQFEYNNGFPFLKDFFVKNLSFLPKFNLGLYNVTRKTNASLVAGLDSVNVEITYDLLQFDIQMAFNIINNSHLLNTGFTYSKYSSKLGTFVLPQIGQIPSSSTNYFTGRDLSLIYTYQGFRPGRNDDINPIGRFFKFKYDYEFNNINPTLIINEQGTVEEVFEKANFHRMETDWLESFSMFNSHSLSFRLRGGAILGQKTQDHFFDFYASGFPGMKGYPYYAIGGNKYFSANVSYRFPIAQGLDFKFLQFYFDKIYFGIYGDIGNAWNNPTSFNDFFKKGFLKRDVGAELRIQAVSWYVYPTSFAFNVAYGLDNFEQYFPNTTGENRVVTYGKEWRFYFTLLFGFDFLNAANKIKL
jgi:Tol biopolymer transport system component